MTTAAPPRTIALDQLGFRPFFLFGAMFAIISVAVWLTITAYNINPIAITQLTPFTWHAHEMIYGYAIAVISGFLLTAVRNWTRMPTVFGMALLLLVLLWALARLMPFVPHPLALHTMAVLDLGYNGALCLAVLHPIIRARHYRSLGVWIILIFLLLANLMFYLGLLGELDNDVSLGLYTGLYLIITLILILGRRVIPMFIQNGVGYPVTLTNRRWVDISSLLLIPVFIIAAVFLQQPIITAISATLLALLHGLRLAGWHTAGIWKIPLLWILYLAYGWIVLGFVITAAAAVFGLDSRLALHAFAYGGIAMMTLGMMARVTLGHTGRNIANSPPSLKWVFAALFIGGVLRIIMPMIAPAAYPIWITASQVLWLLAFAVFIVVFAPMLLQARVDGRKG